MDQINDLLIKKLKRQIKTQGILAAVTLLVVFIAYEFIQRNNQNEEFNSIVINIVSSLIVTAGAYLIYNLFLYPDKKINDDEETLDLIEEVSARYSNHLYSHSSFPNTFINKISNAKSNIQILNTWIPNLSKEPIFVDEILNALKRGVKVEILLLFPRSTIVTYREDSLRADGGINFSIKALIEDNFRIIKENIYDKLNEEYRKSLVVRVYDLIPPIAIYRCDENYFICLFWHGKLAVEGPTIEIKSNSLLSKQVEEEFKSFWNSNLTAQIKDLSEWRTDLYEITAILANAKEKINHE
jgi:hypothetical protein